MDNGVTLSFSQIKYIIYLYRLSQEGNGVKNIELAEALHVSKPSVHNMLKHLAEADIVRQEAFGLAFLSKKGRLLAQKYAYCCEKLQKSLADICGPGAVSENAVCGLLADMTSESLDKLYSNRT